MRVHEKEYASCKRFLLSVDVEVHVEKGTLFNCRDFDFVKQQQVALRLQKLDSSNATLYAWWGIVSLILQARAAKSGKIAKFPASSRARQGV